MSSMERNKGKLIPVDFSEVLVDYPQAQKDDLPWTTDGNYIKIKDKFFRVEWDVRGDTDDLYFIDVAKGGDGIINFHTMHYNGGAYWTELLEDYVE